MVMDLPTWLFPNALPFFIKVPGKQKLEKLSLRYVEFMKIAGEGKLNGPQFGKAPTLFMGKPSPHIAWRFCRLFPFELAAIPYAGNSPEVRIFKIRGMEQPLTKAINVSYSAS